MTLTKKAFRQLQIPRMVEFAKTPAFKRESQQLQDDLLAWLVADTHLTLPTNDSW